MVKTTLRWLVYQLYKAIKYYIVYLLFVWFHDYMVNIILNVFNPIIASILCVEKAGRVGAVLFMKNEDNIVKRVYDA